MFSKQIFSGQKLAIKRGSQILHLAFSALQNYTTSTRVLLGSWILHYGSSGSNRFLGSTRSTWVLLQLPRFYQVLPGPTRFPGILQVHLGSTSAPQPHPRFSFGSLGHTTAPKVLPSSTQFLRFYFGSPAPHYGSQGSVKFYTVP